MNYSFLHACRRPHSLDCFPPCTGGRPLRQRARHTRRTSRLGRGARAHPLICFFFPHTCPAHAGADSFYQARSGHPLVQFAAQSRRGRNAASKENNAIAFAGLRRKANARLCALLFEQYLQADQFDFAFVDADKRAYGGYVDTLMQLVRVGGLIAVDNTLWYGKVADGAVDDKQTVALREFNARVLADERVSHVIVPVGDGVTLLRRRV